jgi:MFS family permease
VAEHAPEALRGSAFGLFNLATGIATLGASVAAGLLWDMIGPAATFIAGGGFAIATAILVAAFVARRRLKRRVPASRQQRSAK